MYQHLKDFIQSESGAVTVDMTILMAGLVGLCIATTALVTTGIEDTSGQVSSTLVTMNVGPSW